MPSRTIHDPQPGGDFPSLDGLAPLLTGERFTSDRLHIVDRLDSTSSEADRLARAGAPEGTVVVARHQTAGRGRQGRSWYSSPEDHLTFSLILRPALEPRHTPQLTLLTALALRDTLSRDLGVAPVTIKWPNDLLIQGRKVAGILTGMTLLGNRIGHAVVGVGLNVHGHPSDFPPELAPRVATLAASLPVAPSRTLLLGLFLRHLDAWYERYLDEGFPPVRQAWVAHAGTLGQRVRVTTPTATVEGEAMDLDPEGYLILRDGHGDLTRILAGEVEILPDFFQLVR